jgi:hypothetical protein
MSPSFRTVTVRRRFRSRLRDALITGGSVVVSLPPGKARLRRLIYLALVVHLAEKGLAQQEDVQG